MEWIVQQIHFPLYRETRAAEDHATLNAFVQDNKKTVREYVKRFTRVGVDVQGAREGLKYFIFESNLRENYKFKESLGLQEAKDMSCNTLIVVLFIFDLCGV